MSSEIVMLFAIALGAVGAFASAVSKLPRAVAFSDKVVVAGAYAFRRSVVLCALFSLAYVLLPSAWLPSARSGALLSPHTYSYLSAALAVLAAAGGVAYAYQARRCLSRAGDPVEWVAGVPTYPFIAASLLATYLPAGWAITELNRLLPGEYLVAPVRLESPERTERFTDVWVALGDIRVRARLYGSAPEQVDADPVAVASVWHGSLFRVADFVLLEDGLERPLKPVSPFGSEVERADATVRVASRDFRSAERLLQTLRDRIAESPADE